MYASLPHAERQGVRKDLRKLALHQFFPLIIPLDGSAVRRAAFFFFLPSPLIYAFFLPPASSCSAGRPTVWEQPLVSFVALHVRPRPLPRIASRTGRADVLAGAHHWPTTTTTGRLRVVHSAICLRVLKTGNSRRRGNIFLFFFWSRLHILQLRN